MGTRKFFCFSFFPEENCGISVLISSNLYSASVKRGQERDGQAGQTEGTHPIERGSMIQLEPIVDF